MIFYILILLLVNTCSLSFGIPVTDTNEPPISTDLEILAKKCESKLLASNINSTVDQCKDDITQKPSYTQKKHFECLLFFDINTQLCSAVAVNHLHVLEEDIAKIKQPVDVEQLCTSAKDWKMSNLHDYPLYKITVDKVFGSEINCARVCSVEDVTNEDSNYFCKYYKWGVELLARSNSAAVQPANVVPSNPAQKPIPQQQSIPQHQEPIIKQQPKPQQTPIPKQQPNPQQPPIQNQDPIPQQQPNSQQPNEQQAIPQQQVPGVPSEKGRINIASDRSTDAEAHSANVANADQTQNGASLANQMQAKLNGAEVDDVSFQQSPSVNQNQNLQTMLAANNAIQAGVSSQAQNTPQAAAGSLNVDNTASLDNPSGAIAPKGEQSEIPGKPSQDRLDKEDKNGKPQSNPDVDYQDDEDKPNFGDTQGADDTDPDNVGDVEDRISADQNIGTKTGAFSNTNIMPDYSDDDEDHFFSFFLTVIIMVVLLYILYHNKNKVTKVFFGLILEGRQGRRRNSRGHSYRRLDTLEQAMSTNSAAPPSKIIY